jgi:hypothetical protein
MNRYYQSHTGNMDAHYECYTTGNGPYKALVFLTRSASKTNIQTHMSHWLTYLPYNFRDIFGHMQHELLLVAESM